MRCVVGLVCAAGLLAAPAAWADIPNPDACFTENAVCHNAGKNYDQDGVCTATTCSKGPPGQEMTYDCFVCESQAGGAGGESGAAGAAGAAGTPEAAGAPASGGAPASAGSSGTSGGSGTAGASHSTPDDSGCAVQALGSEKGVAILMLGLGLAVLGISRRRR